MAGKINDLPKPAVKPPPTSPVPEKAPPKKDSPQKDPISKPVAQTNAWLVIGVTVVFLVIGFIGGRFIPRGGTGQTQSVTQDKEDQRKEYQRTQSYAAWKEQLDKIRKRNETN
jgi:hypothetical protein